MRRRITTIFLVILLISGFGVMAYPWISNWVNASSQTHVIEDYQDKVSEMKEEEIQSAKEKAVRYDRTEVSSGIADPFSKGDANENADTVDGNVVQEGSYANILDVGEVMGYLKIPKLHLSLPIYHGTNEIVMREGVGHMEGTSMPVGGQSTHCVLASHSGLTGAKLFTDLDKLKIGDKFSLYVLDETLTYQVDQINVVLPSDTSKLEVVPNEDYVTLLTCTPTGLNTHRLLVRGRRISNEASKASQETIENSISNLTILSIIWWILPLMAVAFGLLAFALKKKKK